MAGGGKLELFGKKKTAKVWEATCCGSYLEKKMKPT